MTGEMSHDFREPVDVEGRQYRSHDVQAWDPQKRLRVLGGWLLDAVFEDINMFNHANRMNAWLHQAHNLRNSYPIHEKHIEEIMLEAWEKYQYVFKTEIKPALERWKKAQIKRDLERMRF